MINDIQTYAKLANEDKPELIRRIISLIDADKKEGNDIAIKQLKKAEEKEREINCTVKNLYKEKIAGKMPETFFYSLLNDYEKELKALQEKIAYIKGQVQKQEVQEDGVEKWAERISKYLDIKEIDRYIAKELIDSITVSAFYKVNGKNTQDVTINYKFVGNLQPLYKEGSNVAV